MEITFGERLARWLATQGMTQAELAARLGLSSATICDWISGATGPRAERLPKIASALGISQGAFFGPLPRRRGRAA